jgi:streptogramin lyase
MKSSTYTFVGTRGNAGSDNGVGTVARFNNPYGVTVDGSGNAYVVDTNNHCIRKVTPYGLTTTFAGMPTVAGYVDNTLATAQFRNPRDITIDSAGNMYVTDTGNHVIRKISPVGVVTTFAGNTSAGFLDGTGAVADFNNPSSLTCDPSGNVFVADTNNHCIRKITPAGVVTTFAGTNNGALTDGTGMAARFNSPCGIAYDAFSNGLYVADTNNHCIRSVTLNGVVKTLAGNTSNGMTNGIGTVSDFNGPTGIATDKAGYIYVSDSYNHLIRKVAPGGLVSTYSGTSQGWADGTTSAGQFNSIQSNVQHNTPTGMAIDASGNLYVTETGNHILRIITPNPRPVAPTSIRIESVTTDSATINWSGGSGATSFTFAMFPPTPGIVIPVVESSPATIKGLSDGAKYTVYVVAINAAGPVLSAPFTFVTTISPPVVTVGPKDAIVTNPTANNPTPGDATALIRWTGAGVADSITYRISPNDLQNRSSVTMPNNQRSPYLIANMKPATEYTVTLAATKANIPGASPAAYTASSEPFTFTTPPAQSVRVYPIAGIANGRGRTNDASGARCTFEIWYDNDLGNRKLCSRFDS